MAYATIERIRQLTGFTTSQVNDAEILDLISLADARILKELNIRVIDQKLLTNLNGDYINGTNKTFYIGYIPLADTNLDKKVDKTDITVYVWTDEEDESTKSEVEVSSIDSESGRVILVTAPLKTDDKVTADYSFYLGKTPDWSLICDASSYLTGYLIMGRKKGTIPIKYSIGRLRVDDAIPGVFFLREYQRLLHLIRIRMASLSEPTKQLDKDVDY